MFPVGDDAHPGQRGLPIVNLTLIGLNIVGFFLQMAGGFEASVMAYGTIPYEITHGVDLVGSQGGLPQQPIAFPVYVTLLTSMFMHGSLIHIGSNMLFLFIFGDNVEHAMGPARYLVFYLLSGFAATFAQIATNLDSFIPGVGASGAIAGVMGAYLVLFPQSQVRVLIGYLGITRVPAIVMIGLWFVLQLFSGIGQVAITQQTDSGGVAYWAHIGGFVAGLVLVFVFRRNDAGTTSMPFMGAGRR